MKNAIRELLSDGDGLLSTMRALTVEVVTVIMGVYVATNVMAMMKGAGAMVDMPANTLTALLVVMSAKVGQSAVENLDKVKAAIGGMFSKNEKPPVPPT
jgi:hypothetical protein